MSGDIFGAHTESLADGGARILNVANSFKEEYEKMYTVIESLVGSEWSSPAATAVADKIIEQKPNLEAMYKAICSYSEFCNRAASRVEENESNIVEGVRGEYNG